MTKEQQTFSATVVDEEKPAVGDIGMVREAATPASPPPARKMNGIAPLTPECRHSTSTAAVGRLEAVALPDGRAETDGLEFAGIQYIESWLYQRENSVTYDTCSMRKPVVLGFVNSSIILVTAG